MERTEVPRRAIQEDYRPTVSFAVLVRWVLLGAWFYVLHYRVEYDRTWMYLQALGAALTVLNAYVTWRIVRGRPITGYYAVVPSVADLAVITTALFLRNGFQNPYYTFYYPALLGLSLLSPPRITMAVTPVVIALYILMSFTITPTLMWNMEQEKWLVIRLLTMIGIVTSGMLITGWERSRRQEAVAAERRRAEENLELQRKGQEAEQEVQRERMRISQEIHDGVAQTAFVLTLGLERCWRLAEGRSDELAQKLKASYLQSKEAQWELRYPINLGPLFEGKALSEMVYNHTRNFETIASIPTSFSVTGSESQLPAATKQKLFSVVHNALTNVYRHARASRAKVELAFSADLMTLTVSDNGVGLSLAELAPSPGHGIRNIRRIAQELGGSSEIKTDPGKGTTVTVVLPRQEEADEHYPSDGR